MLPIGSVREVQLAELCVHSFYLFTPSMAARRTLLLSSLKESRRWKTEAGLSSRFAPHGAAEATIRLIKGTFVFLTFTCLREFYFARYLSDQ